MNFHYFKVFERIWKDLKALHGVGDVRGASDDRLFGHGLAGPVPSAHSANAGQHLHRTPWPRAWPRAWPMALIEVISSGFKRSKVIGNHRRSFKRCPELGDVADSTLCWRQMHRHRLRRASTVQMRLGSRPPSPFFSIEFHWVPWLLLMFLLISDLHDDVEAALRLPHHGPLHPSHEPGGEQCGRGLPLQLPHASPACASGWRSASVGHIQCIEKKVYHTYNI